MINSSFIRLYFNPFTAVRHLCNCPFYLLATKPRSVTVFNDAGFTGGLVKKILGTKKELETQPTKKTEIVRSIFNPLLWMTLVIETHGYVI